MWDSDSMLEEPESIRTRIKRALEVTIRYAEEAFTSSACRLGRQSIRRRLFAGRRFRLQATSA
jgi:hypothetical protein